MDVLPFIVFGGLAILFVWGLLAPRSQWRALVSWTYRDARADEPSGVAYALHRVVAALGVVALTAGGLAAWQVNLDQLPDDAEPHSALQRMWGWVQPVVLNRTITVTGSPRADLVEQAVLGYQAVDGQRRQPPYLFGLDHLAEPDGGTVGIVGAPPSPGLVALDSAEVVVLVAGDPACVPLEVVVTEGEKSVTVAVYYGRPDATPLDDAGAESETVPVAIDDCRPGLRNAQPLLIPISLAAPLDARTVVALDGIPVRKAPVVTD